MLGMVDLIWFVLGHVTVQLSRMRNTMYPVNLQAHVL